MMDLEMEHIDEMRVDPEVHGRILDMLNEARRHEDLAELEASGLDKAARRELIERRKGLGARGFTDLRQIIGIKGLDREILEKLVYLFGPARFGEWTMKGETTLNGAAYHVAHAAMLSTGKVLLLPEADTNQTLLWDPDTEAQSTTANAPGDYLFCSGHSFLSNGSLLCVGGGGGGPSGVNRAWKLDPTTRTWTKTAGDMGSARWYPTAITMGTTKKVLVVSGRGSGVNAPYADATGTAELYDEYSDAFVPMTGVESTRSFPQIYPGLHLLPGGELFYTRTGFGSAGQGPGGGDPSATNAVLRFAAPSAGTWSELASTMEHPDRVRGMSVLLLDQCKPTVRVLVIGGTAAPGAGTAEMIGLATLTPQWAHPMTVPGAPTRTNVNAVLLPDNTVFVVGGTTNADSPCAHYDPATGKWRTLARANYRKQYHSVALLLPSGEVLATGGSNYGGGSNVLEVFSPPYLFNPNGTRASRPQIMNPPASIRHDDAKGFHFESPDADDVAKVVLVRPMAVTHQTDTEQRVLSCKFHHHGARMHAHVPHAHDEPGLVPLGYYMLFLIDKRGVPSTARFVRVE